MITRARQDFFSAYLKMGFLISCHSGLEPESSDFAVLVFKNKECYINSYVAGYRLSPV
jgi:hypothetical protein